MAMHTSSAAALLPPEKSRLFASGAAAVSPVVTALLQESLARDEIVRLQTMLRDKEERLATTVVSYLVRDEPKL